MNNYEKRTYPFNAMPLPYGYDALQPVLDERSLQFHHDKHYQTYVDNLNKTIEEYPMLWDKSLEDLLIMWNELPSNIGKSIRNNAGGVYNHELYFATMNQPKGQTVKGRLAEALNRDFDSYEHWKEIMKMAAVSKFGSGWAWLLSDMEGNLSVAQTANQNVPGLNSTIPLLLVDVWEHAYYLQYQNRRAEYVEGWFQLINWDLVEKRYEQCINWRMT